MEEQENLFGKQTARNLQEAKKLAEECRETCQCVMDSLERLQTRFRRPTIDLVVIGKVGSGKSQFLQSATGKGDDCIPSLPGTSCTGVRSVIENMEGNDTKAYFTFKTAEEVRQDINSELKYRVKKLQKIFPKEQIYAQEVPDLTAGQIRQSLEHLKNLAGELEKNYPDLEVGKKDDVKTCIKEIGRLMEAYTEEQSRKEWEPYLGISELGAGRQGLEDLELLEMGSGKLQYMLSKSEDIKLFVSKQNHCWYIAVKNAVIKTNIQGVDGRIRLVDTVGIGDPSADTIKQVQDAARNESDGVIFICPYRIRYPESGPDEEDKRLFETLNEIFLEHQESDARYWMAFLQNHLKDIPRNCSEDYLKVLESSAYDIFKKEEGISYRKVIDVSSHEEVKSMLEGFLDQMARHLQSIDDHLEKESDSLLEQAKIQRSRLKQKLGTVRVNLSQQQSDDYLYSMVENHMLNRLAELKNYSSAIMSKSREKQGKSFLQQRIDMVRELKKGIELEKIVEDSCKYASGIAKARQISIESLKKAVRRIATFPSEEQNDRKRL